MVVEIRCNLKSADCSHTETQGFLVLLPVIPIFLHFSRSKL